MDDFRDRLKESVKEKFGTYTKFAEKVGIQLSYFSRILSGERTPSYSFFKKLGDLGFDLNYLFKGKPDKKSLVKEKTAAYLIDTKINKLETLVFRIDNLFDELNRQEINLNSTYATIPTNQLIDFIELLKELAHMVDETLLENQELLKKTIHPESAASTAQLQNMKDRTTLLVSKLNKELKLRKFDPGSNSLS